jgi:chromosome transmission fidelity protein 1
VVSHWQASGVWAQLGRLKRLYREPREASELDAVLKSYAAAVEATFGPDDDDDDDDDDGQQRQRQQLLQAGGTGTGSAGDAGASGGGTSGGGGRTRPKGGALLLSIVGGKMSEGINFSDGLGRCVVMVGLPFANPSELTLQERWAHLDATHGVGAGREYYTNLCLKAVNQSIGRAIRHIGDYATIVLADSRFGKASIRQRLPQWIGSQLRTAVSHQQALSAIESFFGGRAAEQRSIEARRRARARGEEL